MVILLYKWLILASAIFGNGDLPTGKTAGALHPLYISVTEIEHNAADKNLEISCRIFTDDFEKTLAGVFKAKVDLTAPADKGEAGRMVGEYIKSHLLLKVDNKAVALEFVGFEKENDAVWSYFEVKNITTAPKKIAVTNTILYESYDKQMNLMHVKVNGNRKSYRLNYPDKETSFQF